MYIYDLFKVRNAYDENSGDGSKCEDGRDYGRHFQSDGRHEQDDEPPAGEDVCDQYWISLFNIWESGFYLCIQVAKNMQDFEAANMKVNGTLT